MGSLNGLYVVGSSNGLLCFEDWSKQLPAPLLWNPATREVKQVPVSCNDLSDLDLEDFDWQFGFGFSPIINDYKIVRIFESDSAMICEVGVYSLSTGCWRNIPFDNIKDVSISGHSVTVNGVIFWCGSKYIMGRYDRKVIVSFDLATEVFTVISWPAFTSYSGKLAVYDDKLAIIFYHKASNSQHFSLYFGVMEDGAIDSSGGRWSSSIKYIGNSDSRLCPRTIWRNQIVSIDFGWPTSSKCGMEDTEHLHLFDVIADEYKRFDIPRPKYSYGVSVFNYVESLVPLSGNIETEES